MTTLVDTNILLDIVTADPVHAPWSLEQIRAASVRGPLLINAVIYAELSNRYPTVEKVDEAMDGLGLTLADIPRPALFLAAKAFAAYRQRGGTRTGVLPDFFIGAHAQTLGLPLLTRDRGRYAASFPALTLIAPAA